MSIEHNPRTIFPRPRFFEKYASLLRGDSVTREVLVQLTSLDPTVVLLDGTVRDITMDDVKEYIEAEAEFVRKYYPSGFRYKDTVETLRKRVARMEKSWSEGQYRKLIQPMLELSMEKWSLADRRDARAGQMTSAERQRAEERYCESITEEEEISRQERETGRKKEHGIPPELLRVGGASDRVESQVFLAYAVVLAKNLGHERQG